MVRDIIDVHVCMIVCVIIVLNVKVASQCDKCWRNNVRDNATKRHQDTKGYVARLCYEDNSDNTGINARQSFDNIKYSNNNNNT